MPTVSIERELRRLSFEQTHYTLGRTSVADLFKKKERCGIYILHCSNNEYYVGQAVDVVRRYAQHRHVHTDIEQISFKQVSQSDLSGEERSVVHTLEQAGCRLRNILIVSFSYGETDFDLVMSPDDQMLWNQDVNYNDFTGDRIINPDLRRKYAKRFAQFQQSVYADDMIEVLRYYTQRCIPMPKRSEVSFWTISCLPSNRKTLYARINISWQTAFDVVVADNELYFFWYLTGALAKRSMSSIRWHLKWNVLQSGIRFGGEKQVLIATRGKVEALKRLNNDQFLAAVRQFNLGLMRKSPCPIGRSHCLDLADRLIE